jgi:guanosine-3',5'-bis(diphosphate) 3'-pyrophosphohydrolase
MGNMNYSLVFKALDFAAERHKHQNRKGEAKVPYINHPIKVITVLTEFQEEHHALLSAAALHDVVEDTARGKEEIKMLSEIIKEEFGAVVLELVLEVSDDKSLPYQERKRLQVENTPALSNEAKKIKIADKICNIRDMINDPPIDWPTERKIKYLEWAGKVIDGARGVNSSLEAHFDQVKKEAHHKLTNK